jgi:hypothetical protein
MPLLLETIVIHLLAFGLGLLVGAGLWRQRSL